MRRIYFLSGWSLFALAICIAARAEDAKPGNAGGATDDVFAQMRADPLLQKPITGEFRNPKPQDIVDLVCKETGRRISLAPAVIQDRPIQGDTKINQAPAWGVLNTLARNQYIKGRWIKDGEEYVLVPTYTGPAPPLPPQLPPQLRAAMDRAEKGLPPEPDPNRLPDDTVRRIWLTAASVALLAAVAAAVFWRHRAGVRAAAIKSPLKEKSKKER